MKRHISLLGLMLFAPLWLHAAEPESLLEQGNQAYQNAHYEEAVELYQSVLDQGFESANLYYNLGNALFKQNENARAILFYEKAKRLDPGNEDIAFNLKLANMRLVDRVETEPQFLVAQWWNQFLNHRSSGQWAVWALVLIWISLIAGAGFLFIDNTILKRITFFGGIVLLVGSLFCLGLGLRKRNLEQNSRHAIVMTANAYVKSAPENSGTDLFIVHEGLKVQILARNNDWVRISLADGKVGWMQNEQVAEI